MFSYNLGSVRMWRCDRSLHTSVSFALHRHANCDANPTVNYNASPVLIRTSVTNGHTNGFLSWPYMSCTMGQALTRHYKAIYRVHSLSTVKAKRLVLEASKSPRSSCPKRLTTTAVEMCRVFSDSVRRSVLLRVMCTTTCTCTSSRSRGDTVATY